MTLPTRPRHLERLHRHFDGGVSGQPAAALATRFHGGIRNPLMAGQDPSVLWRDGFFYLVQSENGPRTTGIYIYKSRSLQGLNAGAAKSCIWRAPARGPCSKNVWAPELVWLDGFGNDGAGRWYIYFAADDGRNEHHRMYVLESATTDPTGAYLFQGKIADPRADRWAIDGAVIDLGADRHPKDRLFFVWSGWDGAHNGMQHLYLAPMANPTTLAGPRVRISSPDQPWERRSGARPCYVNEGPAPILRANRVHIPYSANGFWSDDYCIGLLSCDVDRLLTPNAWHKSRSPIFCKTDELFAVGHNCLVHAAAGPDEGWWNLYHGVRQPHRHGKGREIYAQRFDWTPDNTPALGRPQGTTILPEPQFA